MAQIPSLPVSAAQALASNLSVLEQARLPPTAIEMLERIVKQQTEAEAIIHAALPGGSLMATASGERLDRGVSATGKP